ncbi:Elongator subunit elp2 [Cryomyces antarcticus]|uniref:Elongator complex protein 2 n=1 Tax=Cryomyces antarcticus TaxID=329879 RepID=A0ABR0KTI7_9PEZI|nr:Elongator subunit elp2 [Cryomyces antarcticus]
MSVTTDYVATGGNRHPAAADWEPGLLAFGADNNVALWNPADPDTRGISALLAGHTDTVNVVKFFPPSKARKSSKTSSSIILSGSVDKTIRIWQRDQDVQDDGGLSPSFEQAKVITDHQSSINTITVLPGSDAFVSGSADGTLKIWKLNTESDIKVDLLQSISIAPRFLPLALALERLGASSLILAVAGTKSIIQIYVSKGDRFSLAATLAGHESWIRSLDFTREEDHGDLLLASASQDKYIRLWRIHQGKELPAASSATSDPALGALGKSLSNKAHRFEAQGCTHSITFEALLLGHEDWIFSAKWRRRDGAQCPLQLLTASADNSLAVWEADPSSGVWVCVTRLGEISAQKGATTATGSAGGFWIGLWSPSGDAAVSLGRTGSWRMWNYDGVSDRWLEHVAVSGHVKEVKGIAWANDGSYLLSTSSDQTTRLYAEWKRDGKQSWHEFSRPQIHGYDINCIDSIGNAQFISGADEKLLRVFDKPGAVAGLLNRLCGIQTATDRTLPDAANIPVLGLSNKAIQTVDDNDLGEDITNGQKDEREAINPASVVHRSTLDIDHPPFEDHLARHMLWPEIEKLYGHGYEISAVATSHDGTVVATACRASSIDHAVIRLYETKDWREIKPPLTAHSLTVTSLSFSFDDKHLLSTGRDRHWAVFERDDSQSSAYKLAASNPKGHARMILDCSWAPVDAGSVFATAGRDKTVKMWRLLDAGTTCVTSIPAASPVTAVAFHSTIADGSLLLAFGTESGQITINCLNVQTLEVTNSIPMLTSTAPSKAISQVSWRPLQQQPRLRSEGRNGGERRTEHQLAVASDDSSLRICRIHLPVNA